MRIFILIGAIFALFVSGFFLWIALVHNPQGEFYGSELGVAWGSILALWAGAFFPSWFSFVFVAWVCRKIWHRL